MNSTVTNTKQRVKKSAWWPVSSILLAAHRLPRIVCKNVEHRFCGNNNFFESGEWFNRPFNMDK